MANVGVGCGSIEPFRIHSNRHCNQLPLSTRFDKGPHGRSDNPDPECAIPAAVSGPTIARGAARDHRAGRGLRPRHRRDLGRGQRRRSQRMGRAQQLDSRHRSGRHRHLHQYRRHDGGQRQRHRHCRRTLLHRHAERAGLHNQHRQPDDRQRRGHHQQFHQHPDLQCHVGQFVGVPERQLGQRRHRRRSAQQQFRRISRF